MLHMNVLHTCMYVYAPCVNLIECLDLGLQIVVSHNVDVEMALWPSGRVNNFSSPALKITFSFPLSVLFFLVAS